MAERRYPRPRSPPIQHPGRYSLPNFAYPYTDAYTIPVRKDSGAAPRSGTDRVPLSGPTFTTYKIKPELQPILDPTDQASSHHRRLTLDGTLRPNIINAEPRSPTIHGGADTPASPLRESYRSNGESSEYITIPASSGHRNAHRRSLYSATMDNADMQRLTRDGGSRGMLGIGSGREGIRYPTRRNPVYPGTLVRHPDTVADDYGDDGWGYTNPRDLVQYDLNRPARYPSQRRDSHEGSRPGRPVSISGYPDIGPRSYDNRERGPPPTTRGLDKLAARSPIFDTPPIFRAPVQSGVRSPRNEQFYDADLPRKQSYRRPVSIYQDRPHRDEYYDPRDEELQERRERREYAKRHDERGEYRERPQRGESNGYNKKRENDKNKDYERDKESEDYDRHERKSSYDKIGFSKRDYEKKNDHERREEDDHNERKKDRAAATISVAAAALGVAAATKGAATKGVKRDDSDDVKNDSDGPKRSRDEEFRRRREHRDDKGSVDLAAPDLKERHGSRQDKDVATANIGETKDRPQPKEDKPVGLTSRDPEEAALPRDISDDGQDIKENRKTKSESAVNSNAPSSLGDSPPSSDTTTRRQNRKDRGPGIDIPFNPTNTADLRALKDALNKKETSIPSAATQEPVREGSFDRKREPITQLEPPSREERGRHGVSGSEEERRPTPHLVSPPPEVKKPDENKPRGILRPPREKFPEDPVPIREGVAPLKDAKKDGVPPDARWTKISRRMVNPEALEIGKERYEAREDFVIVLRVLTKEEIQAYAIATQQIRDARLQLEEREEREERRHRRRERHERHKREREQGERERKYEYDHDHRRHKKEPDSRSESDTSPDDDHPQKLIDAPKPRRLVAADQLAQLGAKPTYESTLREDPNRPGTYTGYVRNPPRKESRS